MSLEENKAFVHRFYEEVLNIGNFTAIDKFVAPNLIDYKPGPGKEHGIKEAKKILIQFYTGFPDVHLTIEDMIAEGDKVVTRFTIRGTHKGDLFGIAPTGKQIAITAIDIVRIAGNKIVERWGLSDNIAMKKQLSIV